MNAGFLLVWMQQPGGTGIPSGVWIFLGVVMALIMGGLLLGARMAERDTTQPQRDGETPVAPQIPQTGGTVDAPVIPGLDVPSVAIPPVVDVDPGDDMPVAESYVEGPPGSDDLTRIDGIGISAMQMLNGAGIYTFTQLAHMSVEDLRALIDRTGIRAVDPSSWPEQARQAMLGRDRPAQDRHID